MNKIQFFWCWLQVKFHLIFIWFLYKYKILRGWMYLYKGIYWLIVVVKEKPADFVDLLIEIETESWFSPATSQPFIWIEKHLNKRKKMTIQKILQIKKESTWIAWRLHYLYGCDVAEVRDLINKESFSELFDLLEKKLS